VSAASDLDLPSASTKFWRTGPLFYKDDVGCWDARTSSVRDRDAYNSIRVAYAFARTASVVYAEARYLTLELNGALPGIPLNCCAGTSGPFISVG